MVANLKTGSRLICTLIAALGGGAACAQQLDEVVVTARKQTENLMDVPIAVSVFGEKRLEQMGATTVLDLKHQIPGFHYSDRGNLQTEITIRGVGGNSRNIGVDSGVGMYVDGVYAGRTSSYNQDLVDVERIEVLRGPQGTLFGKNTTGGAINVISRKPDETTTGQIDLRLGNYGEIRSRAMLGGQLDEGVFGKLTVATWDRDGYLDNIAPQPRSPLVEDEYQSEERRSGRAQLRFTPNDALEINLSADVTRDDRDAVLNQVKHYTTAGREFDVDEVAIDQRSTDERDIDGASATIDYRLDEDWTLTAISGYRDTEITVYSDIDALPVDQAHSGPFTDTAEILSQEIRVAYAGDGPVTGVFGIYYYDQESTAFRAVTLGVRHITDDHEMEATSYAAFGNVDIALADATTLTLGARYTDEQRDADYSQVGDAPFPTLHYPLEADASEWSWTASVNHYWVESVSSYLSVSRGFKSGGMDLDTNTAFVTADDLVFEPEFVTSYEAGLKGDFLDNRARLTAAVFFSDYEDRQVTQFLSNGQPIGTPHTSNAGASEIKGIEFEGEFMVTEGLMLFGNLAFTDGEYTDFDNADSQGTSYDGNTTERTPENSGTLGVEYRAPFAGGEVVAYADLTHTGQTELQADNNPLHRQDAYTLYDARLGYEFADGKGSVFLWGKNLGDEDYLEFSRLFLGNQQVLYGMPRTFGIEGQWKFF